MVRERRFLEEAEPWADEEEEAEAILEWEPELIQLKYDEKEKEVPLLLLALSAYGGVLGRDRPKCFGG